MDSLSVRILSEIVQKDLLGRPITPQEAEQYDCAELRAVLSVDQPVFDEMIKKMHLNYLVDVMRPEAPDGIVRVRPEGLKYLSAKIAENNPL